MFQAIREYFQAKFSPNKMHVSKAIVNPSYINFGIDNYPFKQYLPEDGYLTQAEQQQLKGILAELIQITDENRKSHRTIAKAHPVGSFDRKFHFAGARHFDAKLATLVKIQKKIKHTLHTRG